MYSNGLRRRPCLHLACAHSLCVLLSPPCLGNTLSTYSNKVFELSRLSASFANRLQCVRERPSAGRRANVGISLEVAAIANYCGDCATILDYDLKVARECAIRSTTQTFLSFFSLPSHPLKAKETKCTTNNVQNKQRA